ncbi:unnamed protein product [Rotaria socialis]|uniref:ATP-dependent DNA helicase n=1 Tax=Rotaria socialis TaxID=392032 RepID=A0A820D250_9BILA|nr:unnamed protein product [Rotaria socialis]CAF3372678.1 unnamed protein product [Rotaria socialis]CAF3408169.1 unnamed protein product [Rotaria socialis]CAF3428094.1 unnamed protein product [Rotaria socialis]CAF4216492.1 unnamed protein product [Rotaria socialis]
MDDLVVLSDDDSDELDNIELINAIEQFEQNQNSSIASQNQNDELIAIELEISEIDLEINRLRQKRFQLAERQQKLKDALKQNQQSTSNINLVEQWQQTNFPWSSNVEKVRTEIFKINSFRQWQLETINVTLSGHDCILIMPTGGGKSLCYQLPAVVSDGITIVVSPLISLVEDQVYALRNLNIDARALNTSTPRDEQTEILRILDGRNKTESTLKILYLTPEKIAKSKTIMAKLQKLYETKRFARLIVDEVHCVSQFGHDFRPDYKYLSIFKRQFPNVSILGLTATATTKVMNDVRQILKIPQSIIFRAPFNRKNLFYEVVHKSDVGKDALTELVNCIQHRFSKQSGIVYCLSQKDAEDVCCELQRNCIKAGCYHAGLSALSRTQVHEKWLKSQVHVICATIAFGMGIDKPDVRFVIHHSLSKSIENFYQESGRAGRDDQTSHCILFFRFGDVFRLAPMAFSDKSGNGLTNLYSMIAYCLNESACRRKLIAKYFDEVWQSHDCNQMCDVCSRPSTYITKRNCHQEASMIVDYLERNKKQRFTALKLVEQLTIKTMIKIDIQRLILQMITEQYLKEDFHFTSYATICYIVTGPRASYVYDNDCEVMLDMIESTKKRSSNPTKTQEKQIVKKTTSIVSTHPEPRPKLRWTTNIDSRTKSDTRKKRTLQYDDDDDDMEQTENTSLAKRQSSLVSNDPEPKIITSQQSVIDDEELDFL